jgi:hypothetical protein
MFRKFRMLLAAALILMAAALFALGTASAMGYG